MKIGDREYRKVVASDYPLLVLGKLQASYFPGGVMFPAKLLGTNFEERAYRAPSGWLMVGAGANGKDRLRYGDEDVFIDVTPRKGYVIWGHKIQRFVRGEGNIVTSYTTKVEAEVEIENMMGRTGVSRDNYAVVEFNIPEANDA